jgi:hypothetical protein
MIGDVQSLVDQLRARAHEQKQDLFFFDTGEEIP